MTNNDETLQQRYARDHRQHLSTLAKLTPEQIFELERQLHNALADRDQLETKVAETDLALFAENQKRHEVERQRDMLLSAMDILLCDNEESEYMTGREREMEARSAVQEVRGIE